MASLKTFTLEHLPTDYLISLALFKDIQNAEFLHAQLLGRNSEFEYAFIDASVIVSLRQVLAAVYKASNAQIGNTLKTPNIHSETVHALNSSSNIAESYRRFGINRDTKNVLVIKILSGDTHSSSSPEQEQIWHHLTTHVQGTPAEPTDELISSLTDWTKVRKYYKLNGLAWLDKLTGPERERESELLVLGAMALRGV